MTRVLLYSDEPILSKGLEAVLQQAGGFEILPACSSVAGLMEQMARNLSLAEVGFLSGCRYLLHDRDAKFCAAFAGVLKAVGIQTVKLPPHSPNLNAHLERWHRSVQEECLSKLILFGERSLRHALSDYVAHFHTERNHQGMDNVILFPVPADRVGETAGEIRTRERLGGLLKLYH